MTRITRALKSTGRAVSPAEKLAIVEREIIRCKKEFPERITKGSLALEQASVWLDVWRAIASDYRDQINRGTQQ